jgi:outer membrane protein assembly factor BamA
VAAPGALAAQRYWSTSVYPYAFYRTVDGLWFAAQLKRYSPVGFEERPEPDLAWFQVGAGASTAGSHFARVEVQAPGWWDGWRGQLSVVARRDNRLGYFGLGNTSLYDADSVTGGRPHFYAVSRSEVGVRVTVQRRVAGPLRALVGAGALRTDFRELPGGSVFRRDHAAGLVDSSTVPFNDAIVRLGVVLDTRDNEVDPHHGVRLEALYANGHRYTRTTGWAHVWVQPVERVWIAGRVGGERMGGAPPVAAQLSMETSEESLLALGGYRTLRGYPDARFIGPGKLVGTVEARYALVWVPSLFELKIGGFFDVGRVFGPGEEFRVTTDDLHTAWGLELGARLTRNALLVLGAGFGAEGWELLFESRWAF